MMPNDDPKIAPAAVEADIRGTFETADKRIHTAPDGTQIVVYRLVPGIECWVYPNNDVMVKLTTIRPAGLSPEESWDEIEGDLTDVKDGETVHHDNAFFYFDGKPTQHIPAPSLADLLLSDDPAEWVGWFWWDTRDPKRGLWEGPYATRVEAIRECVDFFLMVPRRHT
jgi:hypothetical protein